MTDEASGMVLSGIADSRKAAFAAARAEIRGWFRCYRQPLPPPIRGAGDARLTGLALGDETRLAALVLPGWRFSQRRSAAVQRRQGARLRFR